MQTSQSEFLIPDTITVHLGMPEQNAKNITVTFPDYIRTAASCELNPTWPENALRACISAIVSFALSRIHTQWYRKDHPFDITSVKQHDLCFSEGMHGFQPINMLVDELFNDYIAKIGSKEPFAAALSRGGSSGFAEMLPAEAAALAAKGLSPYSILAHFYGNDIHIIENASVKKCSLQYPEAPLESGMSGNAVRHIQVQLNRISADYGSLPKITPIDGIYSVETENAVRKFQQIFYLNPSGQVDKATWYKIACKYSRIQGVQDPPSLPSGHMLREGHANAHVRLIQQYLTRIGKIYPSVPAVADTGYFGSLTKVSVFAFQKQFGLSRSGTVSEPTWQKLIQVYSSIHRGGLKKPEQFPGYTLREEAP